VKPPELSKLGQRVLAEAAGHLGELVDIETAPAPTEEAPVRRLRITAASSVVTRRLRWLWKDRIVLGGLTLLAGREGLGKSTVAVNLVSQVTRGVLDGEMYGHPRNVVYVDTEDARDFTIVPRLTAATADLDRVFFVDALHADGTETNVVLPLDTELVAQTVIDHDAVLVVLDAATSVIDSRLDGDKDRQMRQGLEAIARGVGERTGCAALGIVHFGKRESGDTGKLILGSIAWSQVARSVLAAALDEEGNLVVTATKANLSPRTTPSLAARIVSCHVDTSDGPTDVGKVEWLGETGRDARDLLGATESSDREEHKEIDVWLADYVAGGKASASAVYRDGCRVGYSKDQLKAAKKRLRIEARKDGMAGGWLWVGPDDEGSAKGGKGATRTSATPLALFALPSRPAASELQHSNNPNTPNTPTGREAS
jgi:hypothetical protein